MYPYPSWDTRFPYRTQHQRQSGLGSCVTAFLLGITALTDHWRWAYPPLRRARLGVLLVLVWRRQMRDDRHTTTSPHA